MENAALDVFEGRIVLRGVIALESLSALQVDDYQREEMTPHQRRDIIDALTKGEPLPDIELGMRGEKHRTVKPGCFHLYAPVFIIDGQQRRNTTLEFLSGNPDAKVRIGAKVFFNTTREWEKNRFHVTNVRRHRVASNVLLRNASDDNKMIASLHGLTLHERTFVLHDRVCWNQNMARGDLITATTFLGVTNVLHAHKVGIAKGVDGMIPALDRLGESIGVQLVRENVRTFWGLVDECFGIRKIHQRGGAPYVKGTFLYVLAKFLSDHHDFWQNDEETRLFMNRDHRAKLSKFPINDPEIARLCGSGGQARLILYMALKTQMNKGKRTKHLTSRTPDVIDVGAEEDDAAVQVA